MTAVTICIPSIPSRGAMLARAVKSVVGQNHPCQLSIHLDHGREGAWMARNRAIHNVLRQPRHSWPTWIGFLDDDDELMPNHVEVLLAAASFDADVVWPWFHVEGGTDPFPQHRGRQYDPDQPHIFPITYLAKTYAVHDAMVRGGFRPDTGAGAWEAQDYPFVQALWSATNGRFRGIEDITWTWHHHGRNTSGMPDRH